MAEDNDKEEYNEKLWRVFQYFQRESVEAEMAHMADNGTYRFITSWFGIDSEPDMKIEEDFDPRNEIDDEIKEQFVGDDWRHILPFKWFGK
jgi:hypothetical protein